MATWQGRFGMENIMVLFEGGLMRLTEFADFVEEAALEIGAKLLILDNIAQLFGGNENARPEVTQFVNRLGAIALKIKGAVLLLGHPGKGEGSEYSGSTGWDATVRSRWIFARPETKASKDKEPPAEISDLRTLTKAKANYSGRGEGLALRWDRGAFRLEHGATADKAVELAEKRLAEANDDLAFLVLQLSFLSDFMQASSPVTCFRYGLMDPTP